ncbi:MAG: ABC transporter permease, partial [Acidobacteriota bacterium]
MSTLLFDLRHALRALRQRPGFSLLVIGTLALGIGANVGLFVFLLHLAVSTMDAPRPEHIVRVHHPTDEWPSRGLSHADKDDLFASIDALVAHDASYRFFGASVEVDITSRFAWGHAVAGDYFALFQARPALGRLLEPADDRPDSEPVMVLQHLFWKRHLGGDPEIVGKVVRVDGERAYTIVGVAPRGFQGEGLTSGVYVPLATADALLRGVDDRRNRALQVLVRLAPGVGTAQLDAALGGAASGLDATHPERDPRRFVVTSIESIDLSSDEPIAIGSRVMMVAVAVLLLLASANVANLMLARTLTRRRELAVHGALGAGRWHLARRLLLETLVLASIGGGLGLVVAEGLRRLITHYLIQTVPIGMGGWAEGTEILADPRLVGLFFALITVGTAILAALLPMLHVVRLDLVHALKAGTDAGDGRFGVRKLLVVAQIALSVVLLVTAGLLARDLWSLHAIPLGFETEDRMLATVYVPGARNDERDTERRMQRQMLDAVRQLPGVRAAAWSMRAPPTYEMIGTEVELADGSYRPVRMSIVSDGFFDTLGLPMLQGRDFTPHDAADTAGVVVVDRTAARDLWGEDRAIGQVLRLP